ncbi:MAG: choline-sulfatase [Arenicellales bacterium]|mgnify:CR=1 FL=1|jgi:choline-sulfatase|nr:choline-sulfatase [Arenicellales bacterium]MDP6855412.1 choline-sulfatase [Arenicellales bacterium]MDP6949204.1 choline-sulfatase [Arenicellales bacterium]|tara:strand:- start:1613 stop:3151 length:1539 start_codon:yes stop_codon:yes gene_type:complete
MSDKFSQPNIVLIMADQLAPQFLPCYGHPLVKAPTIARLASEGVVFDAAYTNSPLCAPSRFVMMSGRLPAKIAAWDNATEFSAEVPTFAHYLAAKGYHTCLSGKMHFVGPDQLHGFAQRLTTDVYPADFTWHPQWDHPAERLDWYHNMAVVTQAGPCVRTMYLDYDDEVVFAAKRYLFERAREDDGKPFLLTVSMIQPHDPYLCQQDKWDQYRQDEIDLPAVPLGSVAEDPHSARLRHSYGASDIDLDDNTVRNARRAYYGTISDIDDKVAEILTTLTEAGLADNTIVIFTADHGDMLGERGLWFKMTFFEHSARVPLIVHAPKLFSARRVPQAVSLVDLLPTLVELADDGKTIGYATPIEGRSLIPHLSGGSGHDEVIGEYFGEGADTPLFMIRREKTKFIHAEGDPVQYFDLAQDPLETRNLAGEPARQDEISALLGELDARYDTAALKEQILESQHRRQFLKAVMREQRVAWDYQPIQDSTSAYVRSSLPVYQLEKRARFPAPQDEPDP